MLLMLLAAIAAPVRAFSIKEMVIGVATSLTTLEGKESLMAAQLAVEELNRSGKVRLNGKQIRLKIETIDLESSNPQVKVEDSLMRLETFLSAHAVKAVVVGPFRSELLLPAMDTIARRRIPMIGTIAMTPAMESKVMKDRAYRYLFRTGLDTRYLADTLIESMRFLNRRFGFRRVYLMIQDVAWARSTASLMIKLYFERAGWKILGIRHYPYQTTDFSDGLEEATRNGAQVILPIFDTPYSGQLAMQWKSRQTPGLLCGFISPMSGPGAWTRYHGQIEGALNMIFELGNIPSRSFLPAADFYQAFKTRYGQEVEAGHGPAPAYEAVYLLAQAIHESGSLDADRLVTALERSNRMGAMGRLQFNRGHQVIFGTNPQETAVACLIQWNHAGKRVIVYPPSLAEGQVVLPPPRHH